MDRGENRVLFKYVGFTEGMLYLKFYSTAQIQPLIHINSLNPHHSPMM